MPLFEKNPSGSISISENALAVLAGTAVEDCAGIVGMAGTGMKDGINELLRRENYGRGATVTVVNERLCVELRIIVEYGVSIAATAQSAIDMVHYHLQKQTGMAVGEVEIIVAGVRV